jgi:DNA-binding Lrp family transcriptional regulator
MSRHLNSPHEEMLRIMQRLTERDRALVAILGRHRVLTIDQISRMFFTSIRATRYRMNVLLDLDVLTRFRFNVRPGSQAYRYALGYTGVRLHAAATDAPMPRRAAHAEQLTRIAASNHIAHLIAVNDFFTRIAAVAHQREDIDLTEWRSESEAVDLTGGMIRPDAAATVAASGRELAFWFEHDTGSETLARVAAKADRYAKHLAFAGRALLFELPSEARETNLHRELAGHRWPFPIATTVLQRSSDPVGRAWRQVGRGNLCGMVELASSPPW